MSLRFLLAALLVSAPVLNADTTRHTSRTPPPTISVTNTTRMLVIAPHPDDEVLGAGGLMQRVRAAGGAVHVVYMTDGDGYPEGVKVEERVQVPTFEDFRGYGRQRKREAKGALSALKLGGTPYTFLSFPDGGLSILMTQYWSEQRRPFTSPYSRRDRPPASDIVVPHSKYRGEDLSQELAQVISSFHPTLILVPRKEDQHADHCASWFFLNDALSSMKEVETNLTVDLVTYIIHFDTWPFDNENRQMPPPPCLGGGASGWIEVPLTEAQQRAKREALQRYKTQMLTMRAFLDSFDRSTEVFSRPAPVRINLPVKRSPCG